MLQIREVKTKKDIRVFALYPQKLFRGCKNYIPNFVSDEKMFFDPKNPNAVCCSAKGWLAEKDGKVVGRIGGIIQRQYNEMSGSRCVRFTRFECIDDQEVANALFDTVADWGRSEGMDTMHGPWGFNDQDREGMQTYGYAERGTYITNYNYEYFIRLVENYGFVPECEWVEYRFDIYPEDNDPIVRVADLVDRHLNVRDIAPELSLKRFLKDYGHRIFELVNVSYKDLNCYVPVTGEVVDNILRQFGSIANMRYMSLIVNEEDEVIGYGVALPSICEAVRDSRGKMFPTGIFRLLRAIRKPKELEWALIGVRPDYQKRGVNALILANIIRNAREDGIDHIDSDPMLLTNNGVLAQLDSLKKERVRGRKCFIKSI